tara:strand:- start:821 stop:1615 length:795 start_codon:yes stop_codon:yes gene_type:complete
MVGAHGDKFDFRGRNNTYYAILTVPRFDFAMQTHDATFFLIGGKPKIVHGSFFTNAMWRLRTSISKTILYVNTSADTVGFDVWSADHTLIASKHAIWQEHRREDIRVFYKQSTLYLRGAGWETNVTRRPVYNRIHGPKWRFDMTIRQLIGTGFETRHGTPSNVTWPHGLIGQTWDGDSVAVDGTQDDYDSDDTEIWTHAMAEGALDGKSSDAYIVDPNTFAFRYSKFEGGASSHRDVHALLGVKRNVTHRFVASASATDLMDAP